MSETTCAWCPAPIGPYGTKYCSMDCYAQAKVGKVGPNKGRTFDLGSHCRRGHPLVAANITYYMNRGKRLRKCRECQRQRSARYRAAAREAVLGG